MNNYIKESIYELFKNGTLPIGKFDRSIIKEVKDFFIELSISEYGHYKEYSKKLKGNNLGFIIRDNNDFNNEIKGFSFYIKDEIKNHYILIFDFVFFDKGSYCAEVLLYPSYKIYNISTLFNKIILDIELKNNKNTTRNKVNKI